MSGIEFAKQLTVTTTPIPDLVVVDLPVHGDNRGWFKENWQRTKMVAAGLPDFGPVQNNISFNDARGTTRGIHAEPWDKYVSVATGRIFGAWVDLRDGTGFGTVFTIEIDPSRAVFVPRGVGNAYQTLEDNTSYTYLVNEHWSAESHYTFLQLADPTAAIQWPIPLDEAELSDKDRLHPVLDDVQPLPAPRTLVIGAGGQLGRALAAATGGDTRFDFTTRAELDLSTPDFAAGRDWRAYDTIINAAAYTAVDLAETPDGRRDAWAANVTGVAHLTAIAREYGLTLVHVSSDYIFDGTAHHPYPETTPFSPLGVYGQTKAAADTLVSLLPKHYVLRTSWVVGDGENFISTMRSLAERSINPRVVNDQIGRLTFASEIARAILHLLGSRADYGTYNITNSGEPQSWADIARDIFRATNNDPDRVTGVSTTEYFAGATDPVAPRPASSILDLSKIEATGFTPVDAATALDNYLAATQ